MDKRPETIDKTSGNNEECSKPYCLCQFKRKRRERYSMRKTNDVCNERSDEMQEPGDIDDTKDRTYDVDIEMMKYNVN